MKRTTITKIAALVAVCALLVSLVPLMAIAPYGAPQFDDFRFGKTTHDAWEATGSPWAVLSAAAAYSALLYRTWQGTYAASFLMCLHPGLTNGLNNTFVPAIIIGALLLCLWAFVRALGRHVLGLSVYERGILFSLTAIVFTQLLPSPLEGYYWYNGAMLYTFFFSLLLLFLALLTAFIYRRPGRKGNIAYYILLPLLAVLIGGGNYATGLQAALLLSAVVIWQLFGQKKRSVLLIITFGIFAAGFAANVFAPGNAARVLEDTGLVAVLMAGVKAVLKGMRSMTQWSLLPMLVAAGAIVPIAWRFAGRTDFRFRFPPLVMIASLLLLSAGFVPTYYTMDYSGPDRLLDIQFYLHILLLFVNVFYGVGWLRRHMPDEPFAKFGTRTRRGAAWVFAALALVVCIGSYNDFASYRAIECITSGEAQRYRTEYEARRAILKDPAVSDAVLPPLRNWPKLLMFYDYPLNADHLANIYLAAYYGKNTVCIGVIDP